MLQDKVALTEISEHTAMLPKDFRYISMIAVNTAEAYESTINILKDIMNLDSEEDNPALTYIANPDSLPIQALFGEGR
jgi:hypothetical protein